MFLLAYQISIYWSSCIDVHPSKSCFQGDSRIRQIASRWVKTIMECHFSHAVSPNQQRVRGRWSSIVVVAFKMLLFKFNLSFRDSFTGVPFFRQVTFIQHQRVLQFNTCSFDHQSQVKVASEVHGIDNVCVIMGFHSISAGLKFPCIDLT